MKLSIVSHIRSSTLPVLPVHCPRAVPCISSVQHPAAVQKTWVSSPAGKSLRHQVFPGGPPSKYYPGPTMLNFRDQTRTGVFIVVWS